MHINSEVFLRLRRVDAHGDGEVSAGEAARQGAAGRCARSGLVATARVCDGGREETRAQEVTAPRLSYKNTRA